MRAANANKAIKCHNCSTRVTPQWRSGPGGATLCNKCGVRLRRGVKLAYIEALEAAQAAAATAAAAAAGAEPRAPAAAAAAPRQEA